MSPRRMLRTVALALLALGAARSAEAAGLDAATIRAGLRTANRDEATYIDYVVTLRDQGRLPAQLVDSTFQWARRKPVHKKFQFFKNGLIVQAARIGITLPGGTPDLTPAVNGRVVLRVLLVDVPIVGATVSLRGTERTATTDKDGNFRFADVPFGRYALDAKAKVLLISHTGSGEVLLPTKPPSTGAAFVQIRLK
ncbi:MAG: carboxypeptidase regulatory-like domain-containing protein [Pirellulales bacterium]|nr:carboxypeptidase regulatory-like domain-containing protein [Pirellulales bacterium]